MAGSLFTSDETAGAAITVLGAAEMGGEPQVDTFAHNVTVENCALERSGKFMWDYGCLWQTTVWPEEYNDAGCVVWLSQRVGCLREMKPLSLPHVT